MAYVLCVRMTFAVIAAAAAATIAITAAAAAAAAAAAIAAVAADICEHHTAKRSPARPSGGGVDESTIAFCVLVCDGDSAENKMFSSDNRRVRTRDTHHAFDVARDRCGRSDSLFDEDEGVFKRTSTRMRQPI